MMQNYRKCAGVILFNDSGKVLMCARADQKGFQWQFPQGGIENEESVQDAAARELFEETSVKSVKFLLALSSPISYVYPRIIHKAMAKEGRNYVGQRMYWTLAYFYGNDDEIKFDQIRNLRPMSGLMFCGLINAWCFSNAVRIVSGARRLSLIFKLI